ncbi:MAG: hypothetical protein M1816_001212 [Peltula sp. TS41687]|nr:MAG: hypothetical protein M1816_001212 [Peltula sp. TS41687]
MGHRSFLPAAAITTAALLLLSLTLPVATQDAGDAAADNTRSGEPDNAAGAAGPSSGAIDLSRGGMIAIILVAVLVGGGGIASAILFYIAKKRQWEIRKSIRKSARRLTSNLGAAAGRQGQQRLARRQTGMSKLAADADTKTPRQQQQRRKDFGAKERDLEKGNVVTPAKTKMATVVVPKVPAPVAMPKKPATYDMPGPGFGKKYGR